MKALACGLTFVPFFVSGCNASSAPAGLDATTNTGEVDADGSADASAVTDVAQSDGASVMNNEVSPDTDGRAAPETGPETPALSGKLYAYVGSNPGGITVFGLDRATGALTTLSTTSLPDNSSFLTFDASFAHLYSVAENHGPNSALRAFVVDQASGALTLRNTVDIGALGAVFVSAEPTGKWVLTANYGSNSVSSFPINADGSIGAGGHVQATGKEPHSIVTSRQNVIVPSKGSDQVWQLTLDPMSGAFTPGPLLQAPAGSGPRHIAVHPNGKVAYLIRETDQHMAAYAVDAQGMLGAMPFQTLPTLAPGYVGAARAAEVVVHPSGRFLYGSTRKDGAGMTALPGDMVVYRLSDAGMMEDVQHVVVGLEPRSFSVDPIGQFLLVASQQSTRDNVVVYRIDPTTGKLSAPLGAATVAHPCVVSVVTLGVNATGNLARSCPVGISG